MKHDALGAHARDELGISEAFSARPIQAAFASAGTFAIGAAMPLLTAVLAPSSMLIPVVVITSLGFLALLGGFGAYAGGAPWFESIGPRNLLGCTCDGDNCRSRCAIRHVDLNGSTPCRLQEIATHRNR